MKEVKTTIGQNDDFPELLQVRSDGLELFNGNDFFCLFSRSSKGSRTTNPLVHGPQGSLVEVHRAETVAVPCFMTTIPPA